MPATMWRYQFVSLFRISENVSFVVFGFSFIGFFFFLVLFLILCENKSRLLDNRNQTDNQI
jgi:hypothetical protein